MYGFGKLNDNKTFFSDCVLILSIPWWIFETRFTLCIYFWVGSWCNIFCWQLHIHIYIYPFIIHNGIMEIMFLLRIPNLSLIWSVFTLCFLSNTWLTLNVIKLLYGTYFRSYNQLSDLWHVETCSFLFYFVLNQSVLRFTS